MYIANQSKIEILISEASEALSTAGAVDLLINFGMVGVDSNNYFAKCLQHLRIENRMQS